jgi:hypothetical protein
VVTGPSHSCTVSGQKKKEIQQEQKEEKKEETTNKTLKRIKTTLSPSIALYLRVRD